MWRFVWWMVGSATLAVIKPTTRRQIHLSSPANLDLRRTYPLLYRFPARLDSVTDSGLVREWKAGSVFLLLRSYSVQSTSGADGRFDGQLAADSATESRSSRLSNLHDHPRLLSPNESFQVLFGLKLIF